MQQPKRKRGRSSKSPKGLQSTSIKSLKKSEQIVGNISKKKDKSNPEDKKIAI